MGSILKADKLTQTCILKGEELLFEGGLTHKNRRKFSFGKILSEITFPNVFRCKAALKLCVDED